jgi:hypothetical protein
VNLGVATTGRAAAVVRVDVPPGDVPPDDDPPDGAAEGVSVGAARTVTDADAELLPGLASAVATATSGALAVAVFVITVPPGTEGSTWTTRVMVADAPFAIVPRSQVTVVMPAHDPWDGVADTNVVPAGSVSVTLMFWASDGPALVAVTL